MKAAKAATTPAQDRANLLDEVRQWRALEREGYRLQGAIYLDIDDISRVLAADPDMPKAVNAARQALWRRMSDLPAYAGEGYRPRGEIFVERSEVLAILGR